MRIQKILSAKFEISSFSMGLAACGHTPSQHRYPLVPQCEVAHQCR